MKIPRRGKIFSINEGYAQYWDESVTKYVALCKKPEVGRYICIWLENEYCFLPNSLQYYKDCTCFKISRFSGIVVTGFVKMVYTANYFILLQLFISFLSFFLHFFFVTNTLIIIMIVQNPRNHNVLSHHSGWRTSNGCQIHWFYGGGHAQDVEVWRHIHVPCDHQVTKGKGIHTLNC